jgi:hypothetical protein
MHHGRGGGLALDTDTTEVSCSSLLKTAAAAAAVPASASSSVFGRANAAHKSKGRGPTSLVSLSAATRQRGE